MAVIGFNWIVIKRGSSPTFVHARCCIVMRLAWLEVLIINMLIETKPNFFLQICI